MQQAPHAHFGFTKFHADVFDRLLRQFYFNSARPRYAALLGVR